MECPRTADSNPSSSSFLSFVSFCSPHRRQRRERRARELCLRFLEVLLSAFLRSAVQVRPVVSNARRPANPRRGGTHNRGGQKDRTGDGRVCTRSSGDDPEPLRTASPRSGKCEIHPDAGVHLRFFGARTFWSASVLSPGAERTGMSALQADATPASGGSKMHPDTVLLAISLEGGVWAVVRSGHAALQDSSRGGVGSLICRPMDGPILAFQL
jgi:hypothetical protein